MKTQRLKRNLKYLNTLTIATHFLNWGGEIMELRLCNLSARSPPATHLTLFALYIRRKGKGGERFAPSGDGMAPLSRVAAARFSFPVCGWRMVLWQLHEGKSGKTLGDAGRQRAARLAGLQEPGRTLAAVDSPRISLASSTQWSSRCTLCKFKGNRWQSQRPCRMC